MLETILRNTSKHGIVSCYVENCDNMVWFTVGVSMCICVWTGIKIRQQQNAKTKILDILSKEMYSVKVNRQVWHALNDDK